MINMKLRYINSLNIEFFLMLLVSGFISIFTVTLLQYIDFEIACIYFLVALLLGLVLIPWISIKKRRFDFFEPIYLFSIAYFIYFGARTIYISINPFGLSISRNLNITPADLLVPLLLTVIGYIFFLIGYYSKIPKWFVVEMPKLRENWNKQRIYIGYYILTFIGTAAFLILILRYKSFYTHAAYYDISGSKLAPGTFLSFLSLLKQLLFLAIILGSIYYFDVKKRFPLSISLSILIIFVFLNYFLIGAKQGALYTFLYFLIPMHYLKKKISLKWAGIMSLVFFLSFPLIYIYRDQSLYVMRRQFSLSNILEDITFLIESIKAFDIKDFLNFSVPSIINRFHGIDSVALILQLPNVEGNLTNKYSSFLVPIMWIPRVIWHSKPVIVNIQIWFGHEYWGIPYDLLIQVPTTSIGELILIFGPLGIIGMVIYGILYRTIYLYLVGYNLNKIGVFLYPFYFIRMLLGVETSFGYGLVNLMYISITILLISRWLNKGKIFERRKR